MKKVTTAEDEEIKSDYFGEWQTEPYKPGIIENVRHKYHRIQI